MAIPSFPGCPVFTLCSHFEDAEPTTLRELTLMRMEKILPGKLVVELQNAPLALAEHHGVRDLIIVQSRSRPEQLENVAMQMERVDKIEFGHVREIDTDELSVLQDYGLVAVGERFAVHRVERIRVVSHLRVEAVHHHH